MRFEVRNQMKQSHYFKRLTYHGRWVNQICEYCGERLFFYDKYDATCCPTCNIWIEKRCNDPKCPFCSKRPESPLEALMLEQEIQVKQRWKKRKRIEQYEKGKVEKENIKKKRKFQE